jgi:hypothetical protein
MSGAVSYKWVPLLERFYNIYFKEDNNNNNNNHGSTALYGPGPPLASSFRGY